MSKYDWDNNDRDVRLVRVTPFIVGTHIEFIPADDWHCPTMVKDEILGTVKDGPGAGMISQGVISHICVVLNEENPDISDYDLPMCNDCCGIMEFKKSWLPEKEQITQYYCKCSHPNVCTCNEI